MPRAKNDGSTMKGFRHMLDCNDEPIQIIALADLHIGDPNCNLQLVQNLINKIKDTDNLYCVLVGDLMNTGIMNSLSDTYSETLKPSEQLSSCFDLLSPIANKILAIVPGNHEERISRTAGVDMTRLLSRELGLEDIYSPDCALVFLTFGKDKLHCRPITYSLYVTHGNGGGRKASSKIQRLQEYASIIDADVFIVGHTHLPASFKQRSYRVNNSSGSATLHSQLFVNTASALDYGGYGKRGGYQPNSNDYPIITLSDKRHHMTATV